MGKIKGWRRITLSKSRKENETYFNKKQSLILTLGTIRVPDGVEYDGDPHVVFVTKHFDAHTEELLNKRFRTKQEARSFAVDFMRRNP